MLSIYEHARTALADIREINKELHNLKFFYAISVPEVKNVRIILLIMRSIKLWEYLQSANDLFDDQISF